MFQKQKILISTIFYFCWLDFGVFFYLEYTFHSCIVIKVLHINLIISVSAFKFVMSHVYPSFLLGYLVSGTFRNNYAKNACGQSIFCFILHKISRYYRFPNDKWHNMNLKVFFFQIKRYIFYWIWIFPLCNKSFQILSVAHNKVINLKNFLTSI